MSFETAIQEKIYSILSRDQYLSQLVEGVYDFVDQDQNFPYVTIGEATHNEWDTDTDIGMDCVLTIHTWSRGTKTSKNKGRKETKLIQGAIYEALHRKDIYDENYVFVLVDHQTSNSFPDIDALTIHGVQTFRVLIEKRQ